MTRKKRTCAQPTRVSGGRGWAHRLGEGRRGPSSRERRAARREWRPARRGRGSDPPSQRRRRRLQEGSKKVPRRFQEATRHRRDGGGARRRRALRLLACGQLEASREYRSQARSARCAPSPRATSASTCSSMSQPKGTNVSRKTRTCRGATEPQARSEGRGWGGVGAGIAGTHPHPTKKAIAPEMKALSDWARS